MCDCYGHECEVNGCTETIRMHIGDCAYRPDEFKLWCKDHIEQADPGAVVFTITKLDPQGWDEEAGIGVGWRCAILGPEVGGEGDNHPNLASEMSEEES